MITHVNNFLNTSWLLNEENKNSMNKPVYVGQAVLDISKTLMYEFWYDYIIPKYSDNAKLCYVYTDSFIFTIKTDDFYKDIDNDIDNWFDASNVNKEDNRPLKVGVNKKIIGKFKDELGGSIMTEFDALAPKLYSFLEDNDKCEKKAKGV